MDKLSSVAAAVDAGKLPSQPQINDTIDCILQHIVAHADAPDATKLSEEGKTFAHDVRALLSAYKQLGNNKNHDSLVQQVLWHLSEGDYADTRLEALDADEAAADLEDFRAAACSLAHILGINVIGEGRVLLNDFASFMRLAIADLACAVESQAAFAKDSLREIDADVQSGKRDNLGRRQKSPEELEQERQEGIQGKFGRTMDTAKQAGSTVIGVGQDVKMSTEEMAARTSLRLKETYYNICERAQTDEDYHRALSTLFDVASKWVNKSLDTAADVNQPTSLDTFIDDPSQERHVVQALKGIRTLVERAAGNKSVDDVFAALRVCAVDVRYDQDLRAWFNDFFAHVRKSLHEVGYARSEEALKMHQQLSQRWKQLLELDSDAGRKWKQDVKALKDQHCAFQNAILNDQDLQRVQKAHATLTKDLAQGMLALDHASWFWQDMFNVYAPRIMRFVKDIPIPRTEYVDKEIEFVLENLDISSLNLLPGHVYVRHITDVDITAPAGRQSTTTAIGTLTHIKLQAVHLALKELSFYLKDKEATVGPSEFTGIMELNLPPKGVDIDLKFRLIPNTPQGLEERERVGRFFKIDRVEVNLATEFAMEVKRSNHPILSSVFRPVFRHRFREALSRTLEEQIRSAFDAADAIAFDVGKRAEVFMDTGLAPEPSLAAAIWSEMGRLRRKEGGLMSGWKATGTGVVKSEVGGDKRLAMGSEPQILSGEKRGPLGKNGDPVAERVPGAATKQLEHVQSFKQAVEQKKVEEEKRKGWQSGAYDVRC